MKDCIVSFSSRGRENYNKYLLRLIDSCIEHWKGDLLIYSPDHELSEYRGVTINKGWPKPDFIQSFKHCEMPYQFKTALIQEARESGYERIIWLDSSMVLKKDLTTLFDESGLTFFHNLGHPTWKYISDKALELIGVERIEIINDPQIWGGAFAIDFTKANARAFFEELKLFSVNGSFAEGGSSYPGFVAHRHDQSVMSIILKQWPHKILSYGNILCPPHDRTGEYGTDPYLVCRGL